MVFEIQDNGIGMDRETREKIFSLFFSSKGIKGTGLGLFIANKIVDRHGGTIEVESEPGRGTRFLVRLPLEARPSTRPERAAAAGMPGASVTRRLSERGSTDRKGTMRVLVVDDDPDVVEYLSSFLEDEGYRGRGGRRRGDGARTGSSGFRPDAILIDVMLPGAVGPRPPGPPAPRPAVGATSPLVLVTGDDGVLKDECRSYLETASGRAGVPTTSSGSPWIATRSSRS